MRYARLFRWPNLLISLSALGLSWAMLDRWPTGWMQIPSWLVPLLIVAWANLRNDLRDRSIDRVAHPDRPLVRGELTVKQVRWIGHFLAISTLLLGIGLPENARILAFSAMAVLEVYNRWGKGIPGLGNLMVALTGSALFVYAPLVVLQPADRLLWPALYAFFFHWTRELIKDLSDMEGDRLAGDRTLPLWLGERKARLLWGLLSLCFLAVLPLAVIRGPYHASFLLWAGLGFGLPYAGMVGWVLWRPEPRRYRWVACRVKWLFIPAFWGLWVGRPPA